MEGVREAGIGAGEETGRCPQVSGGRDEGVREEGVGAGEETGRQQAAGASCSPCTAAEVMAGRKGCDKCKGEWLRPGAEGGGGVSKSSIKWPPPGLLGPCVWVARPQLLRLSSVVSHTMKPIRTYGVPHSADQEGQLWKLMQRQHCRWPAGPAAVSTRGM